MTKNKLDSLRIEKNKRISPYGEYYIFVETTNMLRCRTEEYIPYGHYSMIKAIFETCPRYFDKEDMARWIHNIPILTSAYTIEPNLCYFDISIYFPSLTTFNIIRGKHFIRLLLEDVEIYDVLAHLLSTFSITVSGNRPISAIESFLKRSISDIETRLKLQIGYPIAFEDIEEARNMEIREQALRKFGYENYVRVGFKKGEIERIMYSNGEGIVYPFLDIDKFGSLSPREYMPHYDEDEKIIVMKNDIAFLQVKDSSTDKTYFLKVPPNISDVEEAKAWTFGLNPGEYNPALET